MVPSRCLIILILFYTTGNLLNITAQGVSKYQIMRGSFNWNEAKLDAEKRGGHLATITTAAERDEIVKLTKNISACWLGGFQPAGSSEPNGNWSWITGEAWFFSDWFPGEPNNATGQENYLCTWTSGLWNDQDANSKCNYVIEFEKFKIIEGAFTWAEAKKDAELKGGHLATVANVIEHNEVLKFTKNRSACWLGGYQPLGALEPAGNWSWITGEKWSYAPWASGEPNNANGQENYLSTSLTGAWNDHPIGERQSYVLEFEFASQVPVSFAVEPQSVVCVEGETVQLLAISNGSPAPLYQWFKDGITVPGGTNATLTLANAQPAMIGDYTAVASSAASSVTSSVASLSIKGVDSGIWKGLVAYYPFNGNANDESGFLVNPEVVKATPSADRFGVIGRAFIFDGKSDYIQLSRVPTAKIDDWTQTVWFKPDSLNQFAHIVGYGLDNALAGNGYSVTIFNQGDLGFNFSGGDGGGIGFQVKSTNKWNHLVMARNGGVTRFYVNGSMLNYKTASTPRGVPTKFQIGSATGIRFFAGAIDDVRIYNRALSETEVKALYEYESVPPVPTVTLAPVGTSVVAGNTLMLTAEIVGANLAYRWQKDGVDLQASTRVSGVTSQTLTVQGMVASDAGSYRLTATNLTGSANTPAAVVTVLVSPDETTVPPGMAFIPPGSFQMGDERSSTGGVGWGGATPVHTVTLSPFAMDKWEVSIELWESVRAWGNARGYDLPAAISAGPKHPVHSVIWYDVVKWNNARSEKEGKVPAYYENVEMSVVYRSGQRVPVGVKWDSGYRLPTEAEWEKAARGGAAGKLYPWGSDEIRSTLGNFRESNKAQTTPIGSYGSNGYGLYDMAGNLWEWCWDWYGRYAQADQTDPRGLSTGLARVIRGGSWNDPATELCRVTDRYSCYPDYAINNMGFRSVYPISLVQVAITQQPKSVVGVEGETIQLSVTATGSPTPTYQWLKNGKIMAGANQPTLSLANFTEADAGAYSVVVSNAVNAATSTEAVVTYQAAIKILANGNPVIGTVRTLNPLSIELSFARSDWILFYTLDGSEPNFLSTPYIEPFTVAEPTSLRVVAYDGLYQNSYMGNPLSIRFLKPQTIDWGNPGAVRFGDTVTLKVTSSSALSVSVSLVSGPATLAGDTLKATGTGEVVLRAVQSGTDDFAPVNAQRSITVSPAQQTLTWPILADQKFGNPPVGVVVTAQSGLPVVLTVASGKAVVTGTNVTVSGAGEVVLRAQQSGNANYEAISEIRSFKVAKAEQTLTVPTIANRAFTPQPFTPSAVVSSGLPAKFTVLSGPAVIEQGAVRLTGVGSVLLRAEQPGNDDYEATLPVDKTFIVSKGDQTLTFDAVGGRTFGDPAVTLTAKSSSGLTVSYRVVSGPGTIAGGSLTLTGAGTILVQAVQAGDTNYNPAAANQSVVVAKAAQSITFPALANVGYSTNATALNATSSSGLAVAYRVIQGAATLTGSALSLSGVGAVSVAADQAGDGNYLPAISVTNAFTVARGDQTIAFTAIGDQVLGNAPITLKGTSSAGLPVIFQLVSGPATLSNGALTLLGEGTVTVRARQLGSPLYNPAQTDQSFVIRKLTTLVVTVVGNQGGTVAVTPLKEQYAPTDTVTLTATASTGFVFTGWSGDLTGSANPSTLAMSAMRSVTATFKDIQAPKVTWVLPTAGSTGIETVRLSGQASDNIGVSSLQWSRDGGAPQAFTLGANGAFAVENLVLAVGTNRFALVAHDAAGNETRLERSVVWVPQRVLSVGDAVAVQEGQRVVYPLSLTSDTAIVAGLTFKLTYDPAWLVDPMVEWGAMTGQSVNNVNVGTPGELTGSFALAGMGLPSGSNRIATVSFRARSVPIQTEALVRPAIVSLGSLTGASLLDGNAVTSGAGIIRPRRIKGDNNANQRIDIGDAVLISRYEVGLEEKRTWDIGLNDLNQSGALDNGDVIKALRAIVGLDPQLGPGSEGKRLAAALGLAKVLVNTNDVMALELVDGSTATVGQPYRVAVRLNRLKGSLSGLSFAVKYPASLTLTDKQVGALVPTDALPFWNESSGQVSLAAIRSTAWPNATGVAAVLTFVPTAAFTSQAEWPLRLEQSEITGSGFDVRPVDPVSVVIQSGGGSVDNRPQITLQPPKADGSLGLEIRAPAGTTIAVETTSDLNAWTETQRVTGQGTGSPVKVTLQADPNVQAKFWRVRVR